MTELDLATSPLADLVDFDFRAPGRDPVADALSLQARADAFLAAITDADWERPLSESAVPGAPAWTLRDHVGHLADWNDEACAYIRPLVERTGGWPADDAYDGDYDTWNEGRRGRYAATSPDELRAWHAASAARLLALIRQLPPEVAASDGAWEWAWHNLGAHLVAHLAPASAL
jgi:hypothetical protein